MVPNQKQSKATPISFWGRVRSFTHFSSEYFVVSTHFSPENFTSCPQNGTETMYFDNVSPLLFRQDPNDKRYSVAVNPHFSPFLSSFYRRSIVLITNFLLVNQSLVTSNMTSVFKQIVLKIVRMTCITKRYNSFLTDFL